MKTRLCFVIGIMLACMVACQEQAAVSPAPSSISTKTPVELGSSPNNCVDLTEGEITSQGYLIVGNLDTNNDYEVIDVSNREKSQAFTSYVNLSVSPDSNALAYLYGTNAPDQLTIISNSGKMTFRQEGWKYISRWASDQTLILVRDYGQVAPFSFFNPFSGEVKSFNPRAQIPDVVNTFPINETWGDSTLVVFDPSLSYFVYPRWASQNVVDLALIRAEDHILVASVWPIYEDAAPVWSPMGDGFVVAKPISIDQTGNPIGEDLYLVRLGGDIQRLSYLGDVYPKLWIQVYAWSPDGNKIAFWFFPDQYSLNSAYLGWVDITDGNLIYYCLASGQPVTRPIWSPDSSQITIKLIPHPDSPARLMLVALQSNAYEILGSSDNMTPLGWLNFNPLPELTESP